MSLTAARDYYGVALDPQTLSIDVAATARLRRELADVHRRRIAEQNQPPRKIARSELDDIAARPPGDPMSAAVLLRPLARAAVVRGSGSAIGAKASRGPNRFAIEKNLPLPPCRRRRKSPPASTGCRYRDGTSKRASSLASPPSLMHLMRWRSLRFCRSSFRCGN